MFDSVIILTLPNESLVIWVNLALNGQITSADGEQGQYENIIKYDGLKMKILKCKGPKWKQPQT